MNSDYMVNKVHKAVYEAENQEQRDKRKSTLASVYLNRHKSFKDPIWVDLYKDWLTCGGEKLGLEKLKTYAVYHFRGIGGSRDIRGGYSTK